jgi:hypothetical protein
VIQQLIPLKKLNLLTELMIEYFEQYYLNIPKKGSFLSLLGFLRQIKIFS